MKKLLVLLMLFATATTALAATPLPAVRLTSTPFNPRQGDTIVVRLTQKPTLLTWNSQTVNVFPYQDGFRALIPLAATAKTGTFPLVATFPDGVLNSQSISVFAGTFPVVILPVPAKLNQTPAQLVTNLASTNKGINATVTTKPVEKLYFTEGFGLPLYNNRNIGSVFGEIRKTGDEEIRHLGTDFTAKTGTPVAAINAGVVSKSYLDTTYGNTVIVDHGYGIFTLYMHLSERKVKEGDVVKKGAPLGLVGQTGYASGPHLHLSLKINGTSVDPLRFAQLFK